MLWLWACAVTADKIESHPSLDWDVDEKGPYQVGYSTQESSYSLLGQTHTTLINIWYPTEDTTGDAARYFSILPDEEVFVDASWADPVDEQVFPLLVFSHGSWLYGGSSAFLPRFFASHGWVVVAPDHTGHLLSDYGDDVEASTLYLRPFNTAAAIELMASYGEPVDTEQVILAGYSFGATDVWMSAGAQMDTEGLELSCETDFPSGCLEDEQALFAQGFTDSRVAGIIPMAGANRYSWVSIEGRSHLDVPVLLMSGTEDDDDPQTLMDNIEGTDITWLSIEGGCHQLFSVGACPELPTEEGYAIVRSHALSFSRDIVLRE